MTGGTRLPPLGEPPPPPPMPKPIGTTTEDPWGDVPLPMATAAAVGVAVGVMPPLPPRAREPIEGETGKPPGASTERPSRASFGDAGGDIGFGPVTSSPEKLKMPPEAPRPQGDGADETVAGAASADSLINGEEGDA
mmetsp:Transcript_54167/g.176054  ORF Transcript_54167/g.176054 Transcript_54167/m.176054 type:complete len:137 (-) Transcript_54167:1395-1805(-)